MHGAGKDSGLAPWDQQSGRRVSVQDLGHPRVLQNAVLSSKEIHVCTAVNTLALYGSVVTCNLHAVNML